MTKVGIVPAAKLFQTDNPYEDNYVFHNNYCSRVVENGGVALGILAKDGFVQEEALDCCDSFLICGGNRIFPYHFQVVEHAVRNHKRLLGICMGMQTIHSYFIVKDEAERRGFQGSLLELYDCMKKEHYMFVEPVAHHWDVNPGRSNIEEAKHSVEILQDTQLAKFFPNAGVMGATMHRYRITGPSRQLKISAYAEDGTIEGIEYDDFVLGIQFHPEIDTQYPDIFRFLTR